MKKIIIAYIPVLHDGYREFFEKYSSTNVTKNELWILGDDFANDFKEIKKDVRRLSAGWVAQAVKSWDIFRVVRVVSAEDLKKRIEVEGKSIKVVMPNDEVMKQVAKKYFSQFSEEKITYEPIFLRWDKHNSLAKKAVSSNRKMSFSDFDQKIMKKAFSQAKNSTDWWRHVGGVIVKDGEVILMGFNKHLSTENSHYFHNDVRSLFSKGKYFELVSSIHAEAMMIAQAAKRGLVLEGASMYVTTFPCPVCAKQIAQAGIKKLFYSGEYGILDGENVMRAVGVELIKVELSEQEMDEVRELEEERSILRHYK